MLLSAEQISKTYGTRTILDEASLYLDRGQKLGIIGVNGTGKSTLLRMLAGGEEPDGGTVSLDPNVRVEYLPQNPTFDPANTVLEQVFDRLSPEARQLQDYEAKTILTKLGMFQFDQKVENSPAGSASGWPWPQRWSTTVTCSSWTSPPTTWTARWCAGWRTGCASLKGPW